MLEWIAGALLLALLIFIVLNYLDLIDPLDWIRSVFSLIAGLLTLVGALFVRLSRWLLQAQPAPPRPLDRDPAGARARGAPRLLREAPPRWTDRRSD